MSKLKSKILFNLKEYGPKNLFLRKIFRLLLKIIYPRSIKINLGNKYTVKLIADYVGYINFGGGHNIGWENCIDSLNNDDIFIDIGAHIGLYTLPAAHKLKMGRVFAFEPSIKNYTVLKNHIELNNLKNVKLYNLLVGNNDSSIKFYEQINSVSPKNSIVKVDKISSYEEVIKKQISLDSFFLDKKITPNSMKIDVEGAEIFVLNGAKNLIKLSKPRIYLSVHPVRIKKLGQDISQLYKFIDEINYSIYDMDMNKPEKLQLDEYILLPN